MFVNSLSPDVRRKVLTVNHTLPGEDLISEGIADLRVGRETIRALLVAIGAPKLRSIGIELPWIITYLVRGSNSLRSFA
jgi:hypothetical protein